MGRAWAASRDGDVSTLEMQYLVATYDGTEHTREVHRMGLFTAEQYRDAFVAAGLAYERVDGLTGRGVHLGLKGAGLKTAAT